MTTDSVNNTGLPAKPVTELENEETGRLALSDGLVFELKMAKVSELRARQAEYLASLPVEPKDVIKAVMNTLAPGYGNCRDTIEEALHLSHTLAPMAASLAVDGPADERDAMIWISGRIVDVLTEAAVALDHVQKVLENPSRAARGNP